MPRKKVSINPETIMRIAEKQWGIKKQYELAEELHCRPEHLSRVFTAGECVVQFRDRIARYLDVHPEILSEPYDETITVKFVDDQGGIYEKETAPEDVYTYAAYKSFQSAVTAINDYLSRCEQVFDILNRKDDLQSLDDDQKVLIKFLLPDYVNQLFHVIKQLPKEQYNDFEKWHRSVIVDYLKKK